MEETRETEPLAKWLKPHLEYHPQLQTKEDVEGGKSQLLTLIYLFNLSPVPHCPD